MKDKRLMNSAKRLNNIKMHIDNDLMEIEVKNCRYAIEDNASFRRTPHKHTFFELHYVTNEYMTCTVNGHSFTVKKGEFVLIPPQINHQIDFQASNLKKLVIGFEITIKPNHTDSLFYQKVLSYAYNPEIFRVHKETDFMPALLQKMLTECSNNNINIYSMLCTAVQTIVYEMLTSIAKTHIPVIANNNSAEVFSTFWVEKVNLYVESNIDKPLTSKEIADELHISVQQLNRNLSKENQKTVAQIISEVRLDTIKRLLVQTELSLSDISESVGISSEYNMIRFFKEKSGFTPGKFRSIYKHS